MVTQGRGYVGIVPGAARMGDLVCVFYGGDVPFILREVEGGGGFYRLIGEAYVNGLMDGEGLRNVEGGEVGDGQEVEGVRDFVLI